MKKRKLEYGEIIGLTNLALKESYGSNKNAIKMKEVNKPCIDDVNKELSPLEAFYDLLSPIGLKEAGLKRYNLIETTLKDHEILKKEYEFLSEHFNELLNESRKEHKALEIIKNKKVSIDLLLVCRRTRQPVKNYNKSLLAYNGSKLTEEEYALLKEVLL